MEEVVKVENLFKQGILDNIELSIYKNEMVGIMGPSGCGKSSLLYQISGMDIPDSGHVWLCGQNVNELSEDQRAQLRLEKVGFVFQNMHMLKSFNLIENVMVPALQLKNKKKEEINKFAIQLMKDMDIEELKERDVHSVSGGQLQRACICRALINQPQIVLADEPTGSLNGSATQDVLNRFKKIYAEGTTVLMVTHDAKVASICDRIYYMKDGKIKSELDLKQSSQREETLAVWLKEMGW